MVELVKRDIVDQREQHPLTHKVLVCFHRHIELQLSYLFAQVCECSMSIYSIFDWGRPFGTLRDILVRSSDKWGLALPSRLSMIDQDSSFP